MGSSNNTPYNPLAIESIADSVARELVAQPCGPLPPPARFNGAGIYAIYYHGNAAGYASIAQANANTCELPIYVGKAIPQGGRKGITVTAGMSGQAVFSRLMEHAESIRAANSTLKLDDFRCRYLIVEELFIELAERRLIQTYRPVWNACLGGFGNHDPGSGRYNQRRSGWDELHPGRLWAARLQPSQLTADEWRAEVMAYLAALQAGSLAEVTIIDDGAGEPQEE